MTYLGPSYPQPVLRRLESLSSLSEQEKEAVMALPMHVEEFRSHQNLVRQGERATRCCALLDGLAHSYKTTETGKRQIVSFNLPGDIPDLQSLHLNFVDTSIGTLTPCRVGFIQHDDVKRLCEAFPRVASAFWRETAIEASVFREWVTNIGQRPAEIRLAHFLCEFAVRMRRLGAFERDTCDFPITQAEMGDATGMTSVHINRVLQELRAKHLFTLEMNRLRILDWGALKKMAQFDADYLHLGPGVDIDQA